MSHASAGAGLWEVHAGPGQGRRTNVGADVPLVVRLVEVAYIQHADHWVSKQRVQTPREQHARLDASLAIPLVSPAAAERQKHTRCLSDPPNWPRLGSNASRSPSCTLSVNTCAQKQFMSMAMSTSRSQWTQQRTTSPHLGTNQPNAAASSKHATRRRCLSSRQRCEMLPLENIYRGNSHTTMPPGLQTRAISAAAFFLTSAGSSWKR